MKLRPAHGRDVVAMVAVVALAAVIGFQNSRIQAQTPTGSPTFQVVSIKPNVSGGFDEGFRPQPGGRLSLENVPLRLLIQNAYNVKPFQISGGPGWIDSERYDIEAKAEGNPSIPEMIGPMLQALLEDRFRLNVHRETKQVSVYTLLVAKSGLKLSESKGACLAEQDANGRPALPPAPGEPRLPPCGRVRVRMSPSGALLEGTKASMGSLIFTLSHLLDRPIIDNTGFAGTFDIHLEFAPDEALAGFGTAGGPPPLPVPAANTDKPSIFGAFQEQLGLRLESEKGPAEILVINHVERPSAN